MTVLNRNQLKLLVIFYKSTLLLSIVCGVMLGAINFNDFFIAFGFGFLSAGSVISLTYKEISKQHEYYFYYNKGISKLILLLSCVLTNFIIGVLLIAIGSYAKHS
jgi:NAD/NADP transhydrogenase beta subunit